MDANLSWVIIENELHHVQEFAYLSPNQRPQAYCPVCKHEVIMRLGKIRISHASHKPGDICPTTQPETALHLNAKLHIAQQLRKKQPLTIEYPCTGISTDNKCRYESTHLISYLNGWDDVFVEYHIEEYRPDIVLVKNGLTIGAVEVFVTHSIEPEKGQYLQSLSIPWIEVDARVILTEGKDTKSWTIEQPIHYRLLNTHPIERWTCSDCVKDIELINLEKEKQAIAKEYITTAFRIIDFYYPDNKHHRTIYYAQKRVQSGNITEILIKDDKNEVICSIKNPNLNFDKKKLENSFESHITAYKNKGYTIDDHMNWHAWKNEISYNLAYSEKTNAIFPRRYYFNIQGGKWIHYQAYKDLDWNEFFKDKTKYQEYLKEKWQKLIQFRNKNISNRTIHRDGESSYRKKSAKTEESIPTIYHKVQEPSLHHESSQATTKQTEKECIICGCMSTEYWNSKGRKCICRMCSSQGKKASLD